VPKEPRGNTEFERAASAKPPSLALQFASYLKENKKWWLLPIVAMLLVIGGLIVLSSSAAAPFIYTFF
jgi:hypothetical protein